MRLTRVTEMGGTESLAAPAEYVHTVLFDVVRILLLNDTRTFRNTDIPVGNPNCSDLNRLNSNTYNGVTGHVRSVGKIYLAAFERRPIQSR